MTTPNKPCWHDNAVTSIGPTTDQINRHCPDCGLNETTHPTPEQRAAQLQKSIADAAQSRQPSAQGGEPEPETSFEGFLCRAWGETDLPCAEVVRDLEGVKRFLVREWLGSEDSTAFDGTLTLPCVMEELAMRNWPEDGDWRADFEIGGVSVEPVYSFAPPPAGGGKEALSDAERGSAAFNQAVAYTRLCFFRDLSSDERCRVFVDLGAADEATLVETTMTHTIERMLFDRLISDGKQREIGKAIDAIRAGKKV